MAKHILLLLIIGLSSLVFAQDNYEIQVYNSELLAAHSTMFELHSNWTAEGSRAAAGSGSPAKAPSPLTMQSMKLWRSPTVSLTGLRPDFTSLPVTIQVSALSMWAATSAPAAAPQEWHLPIAQRS